MRKITYTRLDGGISVVHPAPQDGITEAEAEQRAWDRLPQDALNPQWVDASVVPSDRTFRNAWKTSGVNVIVDMPKARELHKTKLRELRKPKMEALDVAYMRADEIGDAAEKQRISALKQALRDATADPIIEAATTPEALKAVMPDALK